MNENESSGGRVWPWLVGGAGVLAVVLLLARRPAEASRRPVEGDHVEGVENGYVTDAAAREAAARKEAANAAAAPPAPHDGTLIHDEAREARVLVALGLTREAWDALDEAAQRAKAVDVLVARAGFDRNDASAAVGGWARGDILASLAPVVARDSAGIAHPLAARAASVRGVV